jgi:hypothetical protein
VVNPLKTNIMIFTRKYKPEPTEPLRLQGKEVTFIGTVKYLLDPKLNWKQHLTERRKKSTPQCGYVKEPWARHGELTPG